MITIELDRLPGRVHPLPDPLSPLETTGLASELQAWSEMLALAGHEARRWEPKRLRYRLYAIPRHWPDEPDASTCTSATDPNGPG